MSTSRPCSALTFMLTLSVLLGLIYLADGIYRFTFAGWPITEDGRLSPCTSG